MVSRHVVACTRFSTYALGVPLTRCWLGVVAAVATAAAAAAAAAAGGVAAVAVETVDEAAAVRPNLSPALAP